MPASRDLALGPDQPLGHGRLGYQEGARDLGGGEPAKEPERQRDLDADGDRRVAASEDQPQPLVAHDAGYTSAKPAQRQRRARARTTAISAMTALTAPCKAAQATPMYCCTAGA